MTVADEIALAKLKLYAAIDEGAGSVHEQDLRRLPLSRVQIEEVVDWYRQRFRDREDPGLAGTLQRVWGADA